jgi:hypothetical protein
MRTATLIQILKSLGVALLVAGLLYGAALGWSAEQGVDTLWIATAVAFMSTVVGLLAAGALRDAGRRPVTAPTAYRVGLGMSWFLMALGSALVLLPRLAPAAPYLVWLTLHAAMQFLLHVLAFRRQDADEVARRARLDAGMTP